MKTFLKPMVLRLCAAALFPLAHLDACGAGEAQGGLADVVTATLVGSQGTEWLATGGFTPDGRLLLAGNSLDAELVLGGARAGVIGTDAPPLPPVTKLEPLMITTNFLEEETSYPMTKDGEVVQKQVVVKKELKDGKTVTVHKKDGSGNLLYHRLSWTRTDATGFVALAAADLSKVLAVHRFPRGAGSITAAVVGADGAIYIAGAATDRIANLCADVSAADVSQGTVKVFECESTYIARLRADASEAVWVRRLKGKSCSPRLRIMADGNIGLLGPDARVLSPDGQVLHAATPDRGITGCSAFSPTDRMIAKGGEWMTGTGREPWRCPWLHIFHPDGRLRYQLFAWQGPLVGVNALRLVADSTIRKVVYDQRGNLTVFGWSHGGNSVNSRLPQDVERPWPYNGFAHHVFGASAYVVTIEPEDFRVTAATTWTRICHIYSAGCAVDGSVVWTGDGGPFHGRTANRLSEADGGQAVVVASPQLNSFRFYSAMPACGAHLALAGDKTVPEDWGIVSGTLQGKPVLLLLSGAVESERAGEGVFAPPVRNAMQPQFAGGLMDGYAVLLDLSPCAAAPPVPPREARQPPATDPSQPIRERREAPRWLPGEGQRFKVEPLRYYTVMVTFRDPRDRMWPTFFFGKPEDQGGFTYSSTDAQASFALSCPQIAQANGEQDRRVLGELIREKVISQKDEQGKTERKVLEPQVRFVLRRMSPWRREEAATVRGNVKDIRTRTVCDVSGDLYVGDRKMPIENNLCRGHFRVEAAPVFKENPEARPNVADLSLNFIIKGTDLGLKAPGAQGDIQVRITWTGTCEVVYFTPPKPLEGVPELPIRD